MIPQTQPHFHFDLNMTSKHSSSKNRRRRPRRKQQQQHHDDDTASETSASHGSSVTSHDDSFTDSLCGSVEVKQSPLTVRLHHKPCLPDRKLYVAMDCEMVAVANGYGGDVSVCARVVLLDWRGRCLYDSFVKPPAPVTDYRTYISGITPSDLIGAPPIGAVRLQVRELLRGKILVGHGLENDLRCLHLHHPWYLIRDTAYYAPFMRGEGEKVMPSKLRDLCRDRLHRNIQGGDHCPKEDAQAALDLYKSHRPRWEACLAREVREGQRYNMQLISH